MESELLLFVRESLVKGLSRDQIHEELLGANWPEAEVRDALSAFAKTEFPVPVPVRKPYVSAREAFLFLVMFLALYVTSVSFGTLVFQFVNLALPDPLSSTNALEQCLEAIRWSTASVIVSFPVFMFVARKLDRAKRKDRVKRGSRVGKWLTYLTLFIAAAVIIIDLIILVFSMLGGELTLRFVLKVLTVVMIAGTIFGYYLWDMKNDETES
jgi:hypothetical protein